MFPPEVRPLTEFRHSWSGPFKHTHQNRLVDPGTTCAPVRYTGLKALTVGKPSGRLSKARPAVNRSVSAVVTKRMERTSVIVYLISDPLDAAGLAPVGRAEGCRQRAYLAQHRSALPFQLAKVPRRDFLWIDLDDDTVLPRLTILKRHTNVLIALISENLSQYPRHHLVLKRLIG